MAARKHGADSDHLLLVEHPHVITIGRNGHVENLLAQRRSFGAAPASSFYPTDRGGDVTYHGPGQSSAIPILDLREWKRDVGAYVRAIEQVLIDTLAEFGIAAGRIPKLTGVWVGEREDRRYRGPPQPLGHVARLCSERHIPISVISSTSCRAGSPSR